MARHILEFCVASILVMLSTEYSRSAEIAASEQNGIFVIAISGEITMGDDDQFERVARDAGDQFSRSVLVVLDSPGGNIFPALAIGESIRAKGFATGVINNDECASACGLIWLAGSKRYIANTAKVGFHAAYTTTGDIQQESGQANALIGAYLTKLGLSYAAVAYITEAAPAQMNWLHPADARDAGIELEILPDRVVHAATPTTPPPPPTPATPAIDTSPEARAKQLVTSYYDVWTASGINVEALSQYYNDPTLFYGTSEPRDSIMRKKREFSLRWPTRHYVIKSGSLYAQCTDTCYVTGVVEWNVTSEERGATSTGTASFVLKVALKNSLPGGIIVSENGAVIAAHNETIPTVHASLSAPPANSAITQGYSNGRLARIAYEAWFSGLAADYRDGAEFWADNRSLKVQPSCDQLGKSADWQNGCLATRLRLLPSDVQRRADSDFKAGWNSL